MKIYFAASESDPFIKTGGLADVAQALPKNLARLGHDVRVVIPLYSSIAPEYRNQFNFLKYFYISMPKGNQYVGIFEYKLDGVTYYFIDNEYYFARGNLYGYFDDGERFAYFCRALLEILEEVNFYPDIIHLNDWHCGAAAPVFKDQFAQRQEFYHTKTIFTIHNLKYQGIFPHSILYDYLGLSDNYFTYDRMEHYGNINFMKAGISFADYLTTVSHTYAEELRYPYYAEGLHSLLLHRAHLMRGITNGIDYDEYDPARDETIFKQYDAKDASGKAVNKLELQKLLGLEENADVPMLSMVSRLVSNKGIDLLLFILDELMEENVQLVILGNGEEEFERAFIDFAHRYRGKISSNIFFSAPLAKKIYAASDLFLMPSRFEPCGLGQMIAMRYGAIPVVRETGGLKDTVVPFNRFTGKGTGFSFMNYNAHELLFTIKDALYYYKNKEQWQKMVQQAMQADHSWEESATQYVKLYEHVLEMKE